MDNLREKEYEATRLIQQERFDEAVKLLEEVLHQDMNNVNAWWLMANAVDSPGEAREALNKVLDLNPSHAKARQMLDQLNTLYPEPTRPAAKEPGEGAPAKPAEEDVSWAVDLGPARPAETALHDFPDESPAAILAEETPFAFEASPFDRPEEAEPRFAEAPTQAAELDDSFFAFDQEEIPLAALEGEDEDLLFAFDQEAGASEEGFALEEPAEEEAPRGRGRRRLLQFVSALLLIVVVSAVAAFVILRGRTPATPPTPTVNPTLAALNQSQAAVLDGVSAALTDGGFAETGAAFRETEAGVGMIGVFCWAGGPGLADASLAAVQIVTEQAANIEGGLEAVGVELVRCDKLDDVLFSAVVPVGQATDFYIDQDSEEADFRAVWITGP